MTVADRVWGGRRVAAGIVAALTFASGSARAADLYNPGAFSSMVSDRHAERLGDTLTVIINETSTATNSNKTSSAKSSNHGGLFGIGASTNQSVQLGLNNNFDGSGQTNHAGKIVAQVSVVVDQLMPNGDLHVAGFQSLDINGEHTRIRLSGLVRVADISSTNSVPSSSLADAVIDYDGKGFVARSAKPGIVSRIFGWLGLD
jgi:flagellar L-ring protein precursor FlgH